MDDADDAFFKREMVVRPCDVDLSVFDAIPIRRVGSRESPGAGENFGKHTAAARDVQDNEYGRPQNCAATRLREH